MKQRVVIVRMLQTNTGAMLQYPIAAMPPDEAAIRKFEEERNRELEPLLDAFIAAPGPDGKAQVVCKVGEFLHRFFGMVSCGHAHIPVRDTDGGPEIVVPKPGSIIL